MTLAFRRPELAAPPVDDSCRTALNQVVGSVAIATTGVGDECWATLGTVSTLPGEVPALLVAVRVDSSFHHAVLMQRVFGISLLSVRHAELASRLGRIEEGNVRIPSNDQQWTLLDDNVSILVDAMTAFDCAMENVIERDNHALLIGRIRAARTSPQGDPLLSWRGGYRSLVGAGDDWAPLIESYRL